MPKLMKSITAASFVLTALFAVLFIRLENGTFLTLAISFGTVFYHLGIRLLIGLLFTLFMNNKADYTKKFYRLHNRERKFYKFIRVQKWKDKLPTYNPQSFSLKANSLEDIAQVTCQSELVHVTNVIVSFLPIAATIWFGAFYVFLITSICSALFDCVFIIMQRYNRARIVSLIEKKKRLSDKTENRR